MAYISWFSDLAFFALYLKDFFLFLNIIAWDNEVVLLDISPKITVSQ